MSSQKRLFREFDKKEDVLEKVNSVKKVIEERHVTSLEHLLAEINVDKELYEKYVHEKDKEYINKLIDKEIKKLKRIMLGDWIFSPSTKFQENAYKILGTEEEVRKLTGKLKDDKEDKEDTRQSIEIIVKE